MPSERAVDETIRLYIRGLEKQGVEIPEEQKRQVIEEVKRDFDSAAQGGIEGILRWLSEILEERETEPWAKDGDWWKCPE
jgi:hypothetical protein